MNEFLNKFFQTNNKKELLTSYNKWVADERVKHLKKNPEKPKSISQKQQAIIHKKRKEEIIKQVENEVLKKVVKVREEMKIEAEKVAKEKQNYLFKINDRVRIIDSNSVGTIDKIDKKTVVINYGIFTTKTSLDKLELVEKSK